LRPAVGTDPQRIRPTEHHHERPTQSAGDVAGTGVTTKLYEALEQAARTNAIPLLFAEASEPARRFFAKQGFAVIERRDFEIAGVPIHNFRMEKRLASVPR
jgi:putative acetyltransferase